MTTKKATVTGLPDDTPDDAVVYIQSPFTPEKGDPAVGKCTAYQFRNLWSLKGWTVSDQPSFLRHEQKLLIEALPADQRALIGEPEAQDLINGELINGEIGVI